MMKNVIVIIMVKTLLVKREVGNQLLEKIDLKQARLQVGTGGLINWKYSTEETKHRLIKFIIQDEPFF